MSATWGSGTWGSSPWGASGAAAPVLQNQSPASSSSGNRGDGTQYLEVVDANGDLDASTVEIWFEGELAWGNNAPADGWTGTRGTVTNGYSYTLDRDSPLPASATITRRVRAEDLAANALDQSETFDTGSFLDSVDVSQVATAGGSKIVASGLFTLNPLAVHLGPLGTVADPLCYGGLGLGYAPLSLDGQTVEVWSPPLAQGSVSLIVVDGVSTLGPEALAVVERSWLSRAFTMRRDHPPWVAVGAKRLALEDTE